MITLNELCKLASNSNATTVSLGHACALPRSPVDMRPLPEPHCEFAFDSSWEALFTGTDAATGTDLLKGR